MSRSNIKNNLFRILCSTAMVFSLIALSPSGVKGAGQAIEIEKSLDYISAPVFAAEHKTLITLPKKGDLITLRHYTPLFQERLSAQSDLHKLQVLHYGQQAEEFKVRSTSTEMVSVNTPDRGGLWIPLWYLSERSNGMVDIAPQYVNLKKQAMMKLTPTSSLKWQADGSLPDLRLIAIAKWNDWYGVIINPAKWHDEYSIYYPVLLWVRDKDIEKIEAVPNQLLSPNSTVPTKDVRGITDLLLQRTNRDIDTVNVLKWLGPPVVRETSANLQNVVGEPMVLGETWRYERTDAQFTITFSSEGKLARTKWVLPGEGRPMMNLYSGEDYAFSNDYVVTPLAPTLKIEPDWRNQGDLDYTYLLGANEKVLLIKGDDGGYSGMHHDSSLYALDRVNGDKLWQIDAGFGGLTAYMEPSSNYVTIFTAYNPQAKKYENSIRRIRLTDGKVMWELKPASESEIAMLAANRSIILWDKMKLTVLDAETGREKWSMGIDKDAKVINQGTGDPYVLIRDNKWLRAYDPDNGMENWKLEIKEAVMEDPSDYPYYAAGLRIDPFKEQSSRRWILVGQQWLLLDIRNGHTITEYPASPKEQFEVLDSKQRYLLVQRSLDNESYWGASLYETILYDSVEERELWRLDGKGAKGSIDGDVLFLIVDGIPTAVKLDTGTELWTMSNAASKDADLSSFAASSFIVLEQDLLYPYGHDLLVIHKRDGKVRGRIQNMRMGYAELREQYTRNGTLNVSGEELYAGSANGGFSRFSIADVEKWQEQR